MEWRGKPEHPGETHTVHLDVCRVSRTRTSGKWKAFRHGKRWPPGFASGVYRVTSHGWVGTYSAREPRRAVVSGMLVDCDLGGRSSRTATGFPQLYDSESTVSCRIATKYSRDRARCRTIICMEKWGRAELDSSWLHNVIEGTELGKYELFAGNKSWCRGFEHYIETVVDRHMFVTADVLEFASCATGLSAAETFDRYVRPHHGCRGKLNMGVSVPQQSGADFEMPPPSPTPSLAVGRRLKTQERKEAIPNLRKEITFSESSGSKTGYLQFAVRGKRRLDEKLRWIPLDGAALECKGGENGRTPRKPASKRHRLTRFPHTKIRSEPAGYRARITMAGGECVSHCATTAPKHKLYAKFNKIVELRDSAVGYVPVGRGTRIPRKDLSTGCISQHFSYGPLSSLDDFRAMHLMCLLANQRRALQERRNSDWPTKFVTGKWTAMKAILIHVMMKMDPDWLRIGSCTRNLNVRKLAMQLCTPLSLVAASSSIARNSVTHSFIITNSKLPARMPAAISIVCRALTAGRFNAPRDALRERESVARVCYSEPVIARPSAVAIPKTAEHFRGSSRRLPSTSESRAEDCRTLPRVEPKKQSNKPPLRHINGDPSLNAHLKLRPICRNHSIGCSLSERSQGSCNNKLPGAVLSASQHGLVPNSRLRETGVLPADRHKLRINRMEPKWMLYLIIPHLLSCTNPSCQRDVEKLLSCTNPSCQRDVEKLLSYTNPSCQRDVEKLLSCTNPSCQRDVEKLLSYTNPSCQRDVEKLLSCTNPSCQRDVEKLLSCTNPSCQIDMEKSTKQVSRKKHSRNTGQQCLATYSTNNKYRSHAKSTIVDSVTEQGECSEEEDEEEEEKRGGFQQLLRAAGLRRDEGEVGLRRPPIPQPPSQPPLYPGKLQFAFQIPSNIASSSLLICLCFIFSYSFAPASVQSSSRHSVTTRLLSIDVGFTGKIGRKLRETSRKEQGTKIRGAESAVVLLIRVQMKSGGWRLCQCNRRILPPEADFTPRETDNGNVPGIHVNIMHRGQPRVINSVSLLSQLSADRQAALTRAASQAFRGRLFRELSRTRHQTSVTSQKHIRKSFVILNKNKKNLVIHRSQSDTRPVTTASRNQSGNEKTTPFRPRITMRKWGRGGVVVIPLAFRQDELASIPGGVAADSRTWKSYHTKPLVGRFFGDIPFPPPLHSGAAPHSLRFIPNGSQDINVKSSPNIFTHSRCSNIVLTAIPAFAWSDFGKKLEIAGRRLTRLLRNTSSQFLPLLHIAECRHEFRKYIGAMESADMCQTPVLFVAVLELTIVLLVHTTADPSLYFTAFMIGRSVTALRCSALLCCCEVVLNTSRTKTAHPCEFCSEQQRNSQMSFARATLEHSLQCVRGVREQLVYLRLYVAPPRHYARGGRGRGGGWHWNEKPSPELFTCKWACVATRLIKHFVKTRRLGRRRARPRPLSFWFLFKGFRGQDVFP
ncbi:hypothetical protein PR048_031288 [Dryococelus australis]|uniref:Uncharacterized protein n=1 Tax=Dryococelus australis TaxID=614101 RepID=A0ABQ9G4U3_9NEOP|nr:hypothetical protein PR048_031288 [Dryococelus australis]